QALHLCDDVKVAAALSQQDVYVPVQLERRTELALRTAHAFGDRTDLAVGPGQEGEDPVGLAVIELAQHDRVVAIGGQGVPADGIRRIYRGIGGRSQGRGGATRSAFGECVTRSAGPPDAGFSGEAARPPR